MRVYIRAWARQNTMKTNKTTHRIHNETMYLIVSEFLIILVLRKLYNILLHTRVGIGIFFPTECYQDSFRCNSSHDRLC